MHMHFESFTNVPMKTTCHIQLMAPIDNAHQQVSFRCFLFIYLLASSHYVYRFFHNYKDVPHPTCNPHHQPNNNAHQQLQWHAMIFFGKFFNVFWFFYLLTSYIYIYRFFHNYVPCPTYSAHHQTNDNAHHQPRQSAMKIFGKFLTFFWFYYYLLTSFLDSFHYEDDVPCPNW